MKKFVSILLVIIMCLSYHFILVVHASTLDTKSDSAVMQEGKSTQARTDKKDSTDGSDTKDDAASGVSMSEVSLCIDNKMYMRACSRHTQTAISRSVQTEM